MPTLLYCVYAATNPDCFEESTSQPFHYQAGVQPLIECQPRFQCVLKHYLSLPFVVVEVLFRRDMSVGNQSHPGYAYLGIK